MTRDEHLPTVLDWVARRPFLTAFLSSLLLLLSFPPLGWWPLAWFALVPWIALIAADRLSGKRPFLWIWLAGLIYWAAEIYYITIPLRILIVAWILMALYLSVYPILFIWIGRKMVHGLNSPTWLAAPVVFTGLEWVRAHMLSGFGFSMLANSQYQFPVVLQVCDIAGGYGLTFLMVLFAAGLLVALTSKRRLTGITTCLAVVAVVVGYGIWRINQVDGREGSPLRIAVIQGSIDTRFPETKQEEQEYQQEFRWTYYNLQTAWQEAVEGQHPDVIIWPEGKFPVRNVVRPPDEQWRRVAREFRHFHSMLYHNWPRPGPVPLMIAGTTTVNPSTQARYNSAVMIGPGGRVESAYHKIHLVPFGEFMPFRDWFPVLDDLTPIGRGFQSGQQPVGFTVDDKTLVPTICFETAVSHLVREAVVHLRWLGKEPDLLINLTDDGWFYGHAALDHHLACNVMRAVENRLPVVVAANTGLSAMIQSTGKVERRGPRRKEEILYHEFPLKPAFSPYAWIADWPAIAMAGLCVVALLLPARRNETQQPPSSNDESESS